jgi:hypothetical protein
MRMEKCCFAITRIWLWMNVAACSLCHRLEPDLMTGAKPGAVFSQPLEMETRLPLVSFGRTETESSGNIRVEFH